MQWEAFQGKSSPPRRYLVDRDQVAKFARAIHSTFPWYQDVEAARAAGWPDLLAPPTFPICLSPNPVPDLVLPAHGWIHGEQRFTYLGTPLCAGEELWVTTTLEEVKWRTLGGVRTAYLTWATGYLAADDTPRIQARSLVIWREGAGREPAGAAGYSRPSGGDLEGALAPLDDCFAPEDLRRYAEASGDHNLIHLDRQAAQAVGFPDVVVHGMLTMAMVGRWVEPLLAEGRRLWSFSARFRQPALANEPLRVLGAWRRPEARDELEAAVYSAKSGALTLKAAVAFQPGQR
jgi:acyl dehydratase